VYSFNAALCSLTDCYALVATRGVGSCDSMFTFTSLLGAQSNSPASQSLLELEGGIKVLVDVGWDESFDVDLLKSLEQFVDHPCIVL
jgi:hypothetical protein